MACLDILGDYVQNKNGDQIPVNKLFGEGKIVGLYFSADWCAPCRIFTPQLVDFYENFRQNHSDRSLEIIYISWDKSEDDFLEYYDEMPWLVLPYVDRDRKAKLNKKFKVQGIPTLILLDGASGAKLTDDGRSIVLNDPDGKQYPWKPKPLMETISGPLLNDKRELVESRTLQGKVKGIYFSANWCPPCKALTPNLCRTYNKLKEDGLNFEIIFVSSDRSESSFDEYFSTMPWLAIPFGDERCKKLTTMFTISGIPSLVIVDENDKVITKNGRVAVTMDPEGKDFPWHSKSLYELNDFLVPQVNEAACLILFTDGEEDDKRMAMSTLKEIADEHHTKGQDQELFFFYGGDDEVCDTLRDFIALEDRNPILVITDIPERKLYVSEACTIAQQDVRDFIRKYEAGQLQPRIIDVDDKNGVDDNNV
ncbi:nucleoredoxin-like [Tubulanus polymorphus]|uniref:nucleoredoxin-like n=1 Tax=Tubulanus polymorphus TaxID=672921 RepID=UPI003DA3D877